MKVEKNFKGATFRDFILRPQRGILEHRKDAILAMPFSRHITLAGAPIVGANMDKVTRERMAKTLAVEGCFGFLDRHCPIEKEVARVRWVKSQQAFLIDNPLIVHKTATIKEAKEKMRARGVSGVLVEEEPGSKILAGILSNRDFPKNNSNGPVLSFMTKIKRLVVARKGISLDDAEQMMFKTRVEKLPIIDEDRKIAGLITMKDLQKAKQKPYSTKDSRGRLLVGAAIGAVGDFMERAEALVEAGADCILIDVAHAHNIIVEKAIKNFRARFPFIELACGNVATGEGAKFLAELGVDAIKVGIGPGHGCRTRLETGFGVPQLQAIREAYLAVGDAVPIIADGGIEEDGQIALAILCGASTVMLGSALAGTDEAPGELTVDPATKMQVKLYRGMTSPEAVLDGVNTENDSEVREKMRTQEGQERKVAYVGSVVDIINRIKGHLQSAVSYSGTKKLWDAHRKFAFGVSVDWEKYLICQTDAAQKESYDR